MARLDSFTQRRIVKAIETHRQEQGQLPTLADFARLGFDKVTIESAIKDHVIEEFYVTLTNGSIVKGYKIKASSI